MILKNIFNIISITIMTAGHALAQGGGNGNCGVSQNPNCVPEIDITASVAALAVVLCIAAIIREKFLRK